MIITMGDYVQNDDYDQGVYFQNDGNGYLLFKLNSPTVILVNDQNDKDDHDYDDDQNDDDHLLFKVNGPTVVLVHLTDHLLQLLFVIFCQSHHHCHHCHHRGSNFKSYTIT